MLRILVWITRKIAKGCGAFMGQSERLYAGKHPIPQALTPCCGPWWTSPWGVGAGEEARPLPPYGSHARGTTPNQGGFHGKC